MKTLFRLLSISFTLLVCQAIFAVTCVNPDVNGTTQAWAMNTTIKVNVSGFPANLHSCVQTAFDNWNANKVANGLNVTLNVAFSSPITTSGVTGVYQVTYQTPKDANGNPTTKAADTGGQASGGNRINATTDVNPQATNCTAVTQTMAHEIGHTFGLGECSQCNAVQQSVMIGLPCGQRNSAGVCVAPAYNDITYGLPSPTPCDTNTVKTKIYTCLLGCRPGYYRESANCTCVPASPIILDINGKGFDLTSADDGVTFDISGTGNPIRMGWTAKGAANAFLALPAADGFVHSGRELFGNFTAQPVSDNPNGFAALAVWDDPKNGGNGDGVIDSQDGIFSSLRLWIDANHDGVSQPNELYTLPSLGVSSLSLNYKEAYKTDQYGNQFHFRAAVNPDDPNASRVDRKAYDVFFVVSGPLTKAVSPSLFPEQTHKCAVPAKAIILSTSGL